MDTPPPAGDTPIPEFLAKLPLKAAELRILAASGMTTMLEFGSMAYLGGEKFALPFGKRGEHVRKVILEHLTPEEREFLEQLPLPTPQAIGAILPDEDSPI
ncbi:hypothetical protein Psta_0836 [Pirellula staleyi DSM 6068]|uniref:Uncharacterized protein n=1 Tax=Pirellula staleyi (strain ATCC 27377 / DSM 6068 / ICPB 4128) TaxID=530564 RepID=D2R6E3_PIRSD|nr:hypothetical protein [Pirellula staleyi]ADB15521.1 hypothetical protein Psta_0836 [Pirellula staleyi DSM 6068]